MQRLQRCLRELALVLEELALDRLTLKPALTRSGHHTAHGHHRGVATHRRDVRARVTVGHRSELGDVDVVGDQHHLGAVVAGRHLDTNGAVLLFGDLPVAGGGDAVDDLFFVP